MDATDLKRLKAVLMRRPESHKYDYGHVLVLGGSAGMVGAPLLAAMAAIRIGAGMVTIASSPDVIDKLEAHVLEVMTLRVQEVENLRDYITERKVSVAAIGAGLKPDMIDMVRELLHAIPIPVVLDAGALAAHTPNDKIVLTPHAGELARLIGKPLTKDHEKLVKEKAKEWGNVLLLKGHRTMVAAPDGQFYINPTGNPGMATAGSGDVLSGVISGLTAQGIDSFEAAKYGSYLHGLAGDLAAADKTQPGMIAGDIIDYLPKALKDVTNITKG